MTNFLLKGPFCLVLSLSPVSAAVAVDAAIQQTTDQRAADTTTRSQDAAPSVRGSGLNTDLVLEIIEATRVVPLGGVVTLKYVLYSTEGISGRIRLRVSAPLGWSVTDERRVQGEWLLDAWDVVTEVLRVAPPPDAAVGPNEVIRLTAEMVDAPGVAEALTHVQVLNGAGLRPGGAHLAGTAGIGLSQVGPSGLEDARMAGSVDVSGQLGEQTSLSLSYHQGPRESRSNYRYYQQEKYLSGSLRHHRWDIRFGNHISSSGNVLTGPSVNGDGVAVRLPKGRVLTAIVLARPTTFSGAGAGHLWRGSLGISTRRGAIGFAASDFARPEGGYSTLPPILDPTLDPDSLEEMERERALSLGRAPTRVRGTGLEGTLQLARTHRLTLRGGTLRLESAQSETVTAPSLEVHYSFSGRSASLNTRLRQMPPSVQGVYLPGDERSADGTLRLIDELRLVARAYQYENETVGQGPRAGIEGALFGLRYTRSRWRVEATVNRRDTASTTNSLRRTARIALGLPLGPVSLNANTELGEEEYPTGLHPFRSYRGDLRWSGVPGFVSFTVGSYASGGTRPRLRADLLTSLVYGRFELAGGAWATRGWTGGGAPGVWTTIGVPVTSEFTLFVGLEHGPQLLAPDGAAWRFSVGLRTKLVVPLPFLRTGTLTEEPARDVAVPNESRRDPRVNDQT